MEERRATDPKLNELLSKIDRLDGEVLGVLRLACPADRVSAHEERMASLDVRMTTLDHKMTSITDLGNVLQKSMTTVTDTLTKALNSEREERRTWLDHFKAFTDTNTQVLRDSLGLIVNRIDDQARTIEGLGDKIEIVMKDNQSLLEHQTNGLASSISNAVSDALKDQVIAQAEAHKITAEAESVLIEAHAKATPWIMKMLQTKVGPFPISGWLVLALMLSIFQILDVEIRNWLLKLIKGVFTFS